MKLFFNEFFDASLVIFLAIVLSTLSVILLTALGLPRIYALIGFNIVFMCSMFFGFQKYQKKNQIANQNLIASSRFNFLKVSLSIFGILIVLFFLVGLFTADTAYFRWGLDVNSFALAATLLNLVTFEEILFRGFLYRAISRWRGFIVAIYVSSIAFALFHAHSNNSAFDYGYYFAAGVVVASFVRFTGGLTSAIIFHFMINLISGSYFTKAVFASTGIDYEPLVEFSKMQSNQSVATLVRGLTMTAAVFFLIRLHLDNKYLGVVRNKKFTK